MGPMRGGMSCMQVLAGVLGAALVPPALAADIFDDRKVREKGYDIIYEARDLDLPQNVREGFTQVRGGSF